MRMWNVDPKKMCNQHILGEHVEMHMFASHISRDKSVIGYIDHGLLEPNNVNKRHEELVEEMIARGMNHWSPLADVYKFLPSALGKIDIAANEIILSSRCERCRELRNQTLAPSCKS